MYESSERENSPWITLDLEGWAPLTEGRAPVQYRKRRSFSIRKTRRTRCLL